MNQAVLSLGSNKGDKSQNIDIAIQLIEERLGKVLARTVNFVSEPWGFESDNEFLNIVLLLETNSTPFDLLRKNKQIEEELGRIKNINEGYQDRIIDIDIIIYEDLKIETQELSIPHKYAHERNFVVEPLKSILNQVKNENLYKACQQIIKKYDSI